MKRAGVWLSIGLLCSFAAGAAAGPQLGKLLKGGGIMLVVHTFGPQINRFINGLTHTSTTGENYATKVVPVLSVGTGAYAGAVQVMGPGARVSQVQAVAEVGGNFRPLGVQVRALVPIASTKVTSLRRVPGVGVSGIIDVKL
ncbi:MAG: hypothetical protein KGJ62_02580 [Armatimonadetes bacterium]|nr:hypothetical protein [Armatimonadota bacterium]MDE2205294.1 hypothetical protein [Armatimonadota bacterium]